MSDERKELVDIFDKLVGNITNPSNQLWQKCEQIRKLIVQQKPEIDRIERMLKWFIIRYVEGSNEAPYAEISDVLKEVK